MGANGGPSPALHLPSIGVARADACVQEMQCGARGCSPSACISWAHPAWAALDTPPSRGHPPVPSLRARSAALGAPRPRLLSSQAEPLRPLPPGMRRDGLPTPAHRLLTTEAARNALVFPGSTYLALNLLHHFGCWGSDEQL
jgi:hypothetical protein